MKVYIAKLELYPVYSDSKFYCGKEIDVPEDLWNKYLLAKDTFLDLLYELEDVVEKIYR